MTERCAVYWLLHLKDKGYTPVWASDYEHLLLKEDDGFDWRNLKGKGKYEDDEDEVDGDQELDEDEGDGELDVDEDDFDLTY